MLYNINNQQIIFFLFYSLYIKPVFTRKFNIEITNFISQKLNLHLIHFRETKLLFNPPIEQQALHLFTN